MGKRALAALAVLLAAALLAGCKRSSLARNFGQNVGQWSPRVNQDAPESTPRVSAIESFETPAFGEALGFGVTAWPDSDELSLGNCYAIDGWIGQLEYHSPDEWLLVLRVAREDEMPLVTLYNDSYYREPEEREADGVTVRQTSSAEGAAIAVWKKDGFQYSLHSNKLQGRMPDEMVDAFVREIETEES